MSSFDIDTFINCHCVKSVQIRSFFWSVFSCIRTEYGDLRCKSPYSVQIQKNTDQKKLRIWTLFTQCAYGNCYTFSGCSAKSELHHSFIDSFIHL